MSEVSEILTAPDEQVTSHGRGPPPGEPSQGGPQRPHSSPPLSRKPRSKAKTAWQKAILTTKSNIDKQRPVSAVRKRYKSVSSDGTPASGGRARKEQKDCEK